MATMVRVESRRFHTYDGIDRPEGTIYEAEAEYLETLEAMGMARRVDDAPPADAAEAAPAKKKK